MEYWLLLLGVLLLRIVVPAASVLMTLSLGLRLEVVTQGTIDRGSKYQPEKLHLRLLCILGRPLHLDFL